jgi:hypothetical protein
MINRRFMIVPPALLSGGHAGQLEQTSKDFPRAQPRLDSMAWQWPGYARGNGDGRICGNTLACSFANSA